METDKDNGYIFRWLQDYVLSNGKDLDPKADIERITKNLIDTQITITINSINRAIKEGMESAIIYEDLKELRRVRNNEITRNEYKNNPIKKVADEYAAEIKYRVSDLWVPCLVLVIVNSNTIPSYKNAVNEAITYVEDFIYKICYKTKCNITTTTTITEQLIYKICDITHKIYYKSKFDITQRKISESSKRINELLELIKPPFKDPKNDNYYKEIDEIEFNLSDYLIAANKDVYKREQCKEIAAAIVKRVYEKINNTIHLKSIIPNNYTIPNNKLANELPKDLLGEGNVSLVVGKCKSKKEILTTVSVDYDSEGIQIYNKSERFTPYDRVVHNAVCSLFEAGNKEFTALMVYRCMNGLVNNEKVSPQAVGAVTKSLDKVSRIRCRIDWTTEAKARNCNIDKGILEANILATKKIIITASGKTMEAYQLLDKPILYTYAQETKQIITIPIKLLQTKGTIRATDDVIILREYLLRRIEVMKNNNKQTNKILYESVYKEVGLNLQVKDQSFLDKTKKIRKAVTEILNYWKNEKYIESFSEYKEGKMFKGIDIFFN